MGRSTSVRVDQAALAAATSVQNAVRNGVTIPLETIAAGSLCVACTSVLNTASVVATYTAQVSNDNSTWFDVRPSNMAGIVDVAAASGTTTRCLQFSDLSGWKFFRVNAVLSGAAVSGDTTAARYVYRKFGST